jgi:pimeloyl-ACP methyl ester carboxylesterase
VTPQLLLIPGLACDGRLFAGQIEALSGLADVTVADCTRDETISSMAARILAGAPDRFALAGLSMGGYVCFEIMRLAPHRVTRLCVMDTTARPDTEDATQRRMKMIALAREGRLDTIHDETLPRLLHPSNAADPALGATIRAMLEGTGAAAYERQQRAIIGRMDSRTALEHVAVPTLVIVGEADAITPPAMAREMAEIIPGARLAVISGAGHLSTLEQPGAVTRELEVWLRA